MIEFASAPPQTRPAAAKVGPVRFDPLTQAQALDAIALLVARGRGGFVTTPNVDHIVLAHEHPGLAEAYRKTALSLVDGQPVVWMARLLGRPVPEKVSGSDLIGPLMARAAQDAWRVYLLGGSAQVSALAEMRLKQRYPGLIVCGRDTSRWDPHGADAIASAERIRRARPDLVIVALGCPKQELWMARYGPYIAPAVAIGLGGSLDFVAGAVRRAPRWVSRMGLEWIYRLLQEPRRLAYRYLVRDVKVVPLFTRAWLDARRARRGVVADITPARGGQRAAA